MGLNKEGVNKGQSHLPFYHRSRKINEIDFFGDRGEKESLLNSLNSRLGQSRWKFFKVLGW